MLCYLCVSCVCVVCLHKAYLQHITAHRRHIYSICTSGQTGNLSVESLTKQDRFNVLTAISKGLCCVQCMYIYTYIRTYIHTYIHTDLIRWAIDSPEKFLEMKQELAVLKEKFCGCKVAQHTTPSYGTNNHATHQKELKP